MRRFTLAIAVAAVALALHAPAVAACGGLVAPNGSVRLQRATTLVDWHDGVEHYLTSFSFLGQVDGIGWIVPLPAVPLSIQEGGGWTLQRLERQVRPPVIALAQPGARAAAGAAEVLQQVSVEALDVTVLRGSGQAVIDWCTRNGFVLPESTRAHLQTYAQASPIFMAAKYNLATARARALRGGDGTPLLITMLTPHLWVPLEVLATDDGPVVADLFLLSDDPLQPGPSDTPLPGAPGFVVRSQERMTPALFHDLSTDRNMGWVRAGSWLTYLTLDAPSDSVTYDLDVMPSSDIKLVSFGTAPGLAGAAPAPPLRPEAPVATASGTWRAVTAAAVGAIVLATATVVVRARRRGARASGGRGSRA